MHSFTGIIPAPHSSKRLAKTKQDSFRFPGALAVLPNFINYEATNLAVTKSASTIKSSLTGLVNLTSPILSVKNSLYTQTALLGILSQHSVIFLSVATASFIRLMFDSFQSFIFDLTKRAVASRVTESGFNSSICSYRPLKPSTFNFQSASSNFATCPASKNY